MSEAHPLSPNIPALTLGWRLRMAIEHADVKVGDLADALGVTRGTVSRWTHDDGAPPRDGFIRLIALRCGVPYSWIKDGVEPAPEDDGDGPNGASDLPTGQFTGSSGGRVYQFTRPASGGTRLDEVA